MAANIGDNILQASQVVLSTFERQNQFQLQQIAFQEQLAQADANMKLKEREIQMREKMAALQEKQAKLQIKAAENQQNVFTAAGGAEGEASRIDAGTRNLEARTAHLEAQATATLAKSSGGGLSATEHSKLRSTLADRSAETWQRLEARRLADEDERFKPFAGRSLDEIRSIRAEMDKEVANPDMLKVLIEQRLAFQLKDVDSIAELRTNMNDYEAAVMDATRGAPPVDLQREVWSQMRAGDRNLTDLTFNEIFLGQAGQVTTGERLRAAVALPGLNDLDTARIQGAIEGMRPNQLIAEWGPRLYDDNGDVKPKQMEQLLKAVYDTHGNTENFQKFVSELKTLLNRQR